MPLQVSAQRCADVQVVLSHCATLLALSPETDCSDERASQARDVVHMLREYIAHAQQLLEQLETQLGEDERITCQ